MTERNGIKHESVWGMRKRREQREKRWDWTRRDEGKRWINSRGHERRDDRKRGMRQRRVNREKKVKERWDEEEELTAEEREGWEEGIISHSGSVQWGSIICCICATCSDQCDDRNLREEKWSERSANSQQLLQTHATEAALQSDSTRGSLQLMKRHKSSARFRLHAMVKSTRAWVWNLPNDFWNKSSSMWASPKHVVIFKVSIITIWTTICNYVTSFTSKACSDLGEGESPEHDFMP